MCAASRSRSAAMFGDCRHDGNSGEQVSMLNSSTSDPTVTKALNLIAEFETWCKDRPNGIGYIVALFLETMRTTSRTISGETLKVLCRDRAGIHAGRDEYALKSDLIQVCVRSLAKQWPEYADRIRTRDSRFDLPEVSGHILPIGKYFDLSSIDGYMV